MKDCATMLSIHEGMGTTQTDRMLQALATDFFQIDERKTEDYILFVQKLSKYVIFFNETDSPDGDWSVLFETESTAILVYISAWNIEYAVQQYEIQKTIIAKNTVFLVQKSILLNYFQQLEKEYNLLLAKAQRLDSEIPEKESLIGTDYAIQTQFATLYQQINLATDIVSLLENYYYLRCVQQLFGLLTTWKQFATAPIQHQLENYDKHTPHYALFLAFLKLMEVAKAKLNEFTKNQLDFYYKEVLKVQNEAAKPDFVHLTLEPHKGTKPFLIPKNTIFLGGKNALGQKKYFASTADQTVNAIQLQSFCSVHSDTTALYKVPDLTVANDTGTSFDVFTQNPMLFQEGFLVASPLLFLQSGERTLFLRINDQDLEASKFHFFITGEKKTIEITEKTTVKKDPKQTDTYIQLTIPATEKAIVPFDAKKHPEFLVETLFPVLKIVPVNREVLKTVSKIDLEIKVEGFKSFVLESDFGSINVEKPFYPFGEFPKNGNGITIASNEFFMKKNAKATFDITMEFKTKPMGKPKKIQKEDKKIIIFSEKNWLYNKVETFELVNGFWSKKDTSLKHMTNDYALQEYHFDELVTSEIVSNGKFRMVLDDPAYAGESYMQKYIKASAEKTTLPYKPKIKSFVFDYTVQEIIHLGKNTVKEKMLFGQHPFEFFKDKTEIFLKGNDKKNPVDVFTVDPFGFRKITLGALKFSNLKPNEGYIYLGFKNASSKDGLSLLIQLEEGTANPLLEPATIKWQYLSSNSWLDFEANAIGDETFSLTQSGIVAITVPDYKASTNTVLSKELFWIRIAVSNKQAICKWLGVHTQALKAVLTDYEQIGSVFTEITPKETVSKSFASLNGVKKIKQPYASFGGKLTESDTFLYQRLSERLRHKNRAITSWDYEHIILQEFPEVYRVKTLNHYRYDTQLSNVAAGYVSLIVVAKSSPTENINWKPLLSLNKMLQIKEFVKTISSPHARICVKPPKPEKVELHFKVRFHKTAGMDSRLYLKQLVQTINEFLSPWAYDAAEVQFANSIEFSTLIQLVDNQPYVDYITDFNVTQYLLDAEYNPVGSAIKNLTKVTPQTDFTLFVPTETHQIQEI